MITEAANEAVRALVRDRRPSALVAPAERNAIVQQPDDAEAQPAADEQAARRRTHRRESEQLSEAIVRQTKKVSALTNFEGCSAAVLCCVGCAELGRARGVRGEHHCCEPDVDTHGPLLVFETPPRSRPGNTTAVPM